MVIQQYGIPNRMEILPPDDRIPSTLSYYVICGLARYVARARVKTRWSTIYGACPVYAVLISTMFKAHGMHTKNLIYGPALNLCQCPKAEVFSWITKVTRITVESWFVCTDMEGPIMPNLRCWPWHRRLNQFIVVGTHLFQLPNKGSILQCPVWPLYFRLWWLQFQVILKERLVFCWIYIQFLMYNDHHIHTLILFASACFVFYQSMDRWVLWIDHVGVGSTLTQCLPGSSSHWTWCGMLEITSIRTEFLPE